MRWSVHALNLCRITLPKRRILELVAEHFLEPLIRFVPEELSTIARRFNAGWFVKSFSRPDWT